MPCIASSHFFRARLSGFHQSSDRMSRIIEIATWGKAARANVVFVHGLGGHAYDTWRWNADGDTFWPLWLAEDLEGLTVHTLAYEAPPSNWWGTSMALQDRAANVLESLLAAPSLADGPVVFVCHSLGGLIIKQIILDMDQQKEERPEIASLLKRVTQVVFLATPHTGSRMASLLAQIRFLAWPTSIVRLLVANDPTLRAINQNYRGLAQRRNGSLSHLIFYETKNIQGCVVVDEASSDPGLPGRRPIPIDADHIRIAKPGDRQSLLYSVVRNFVAENPPRQGDLAIAMLDEPDRSMVLREATTDEQANTSLTNPQRRLTKHELPDIKTERNLNMVPKLLRLFFLLLFAAVLFKGVEAVIFPPAPPPLERLSVGEIRLLNENGKQGQAPNARLPRYETRRGNYFEFSDLRDLLVPVAFMIRGIPNPCQRRENITVNIVGEGIQRDRNAFEYKISVPSNYRPLHDISNVFLVRECEAVPVIALVGCLKPDEVANFSGSFRIHVSYLGTQAESEPFPIVLAKPVNLAAQSASPNCPKRD